MGKVGKSVFFLILDEIAAGSHFGCPKITFDHSSCHFRSIRNFFCCWNFWTKWPPAAILDWTTMSVIELVRDIWMNNACVKFEELSLNPWKVIALTTKLWRGGHNIPENFIMMSYHSFYYKAIMFVIIGIEIHKTNIIKECSRDTIDQGILQHWLTYGNTIDQGILQHWLTYGNTIDQGILQHWLTYGDTIDQGILQHWLTYGINTTLFVCLWSG